MVKALLLAFFCLVISMSSFASSSAPKCKGLFGESGSLGYFPPHLGLIKFKDPLWERFILKESFANLNLAEGTYNVSKLGEGSKGGSVFLISSRSGAFADYVIKIYRNINVLENDMAAFNKVAEILNKHEVLINIPEFKRLDDNVLRLAHIRGVAVDNIIYAEHLPHKLVASKVRGEFETTLKMLRYYFSRLPNTEVFDVGVNSTSGDRYHVQYFMQVKGRKDSLKFYFKPNNFVVDSKTLEIWMIDPF